VRGSNHSGLQRTGGPVGRQSYPAAFAFPAPRVPVRTVVESFPPEEGNEMLWKLRAGELSAVAVLASANASVAA